MAEDRKREPTLWRGSRTEENLRAAFAAESMAQSRYTAYSRRAGKKGDHGEEGFFADMAGQNQAHAELWLSLLEEELGVTGQELPAAREGAHYAWSEMYAAYAAQAREEGFGELAELFEKIAGIEAEHERRCEQLLEQRRKTGEVSAAGTAEQLQTAEEVVEKVMMAETENAAVSAPGAEVAEELLEADAVG